jgi:hypothetical protein
MPTPRDDRVLPGTRALALFIVPFLLAAFVLFLFPARSGDWFAWPVKPRMTPLIMGAGYLAGAYFFTRVVFARQWHRVHLGFLPITAFTIFEEIATLRHLDRFVHDRVVFWIWTGLYTITPVLVPLAWWLNRKRDPGTLEAGDVYVPSRVRALLAGVGSVQCVIAAILLLSPSTMIDVWPWTLTPLTAGVLGGWFALPGVVALMMAIDGRWSAIRITLQSQAIGLTLILVGVARAWDDFDTSNVVTYLFVGGIAFLLAGLAALAMYMNALQRRTHGDRPVVPVAEVHGVR